MEVRFGNLTVEQFEEKTKVKFSDEDRKWLEERRTDNANDPSDDKFHIFNMPLSINAGYNIAEELIVRLGNGYDFEGSFTVSQKEASATLTPSELPF